MDLTPYLRDMRDALEREDRLTAHEHAQQVLALLPEGEDTDPLALDLLGQLADVHKDAGDADRAGALRLAMATRQAGDENLVAFGECLGMGIVLDGWGDLARRDAEATWYETFLQDLGEDLARYGWETPEDGDTERAPQQIYGRAWFHFSFGLFEDEAKAVRELMAVLETRGAPVTAFRGLHQRLAWIQRELTPA